MKQPKPIDIPFLKTMVAIIEITLDPRSSKRDKYAARQVIALYHSEMDMDQLAAAWRVLHRARVAQQKTGHK